jgi:hypothetical protein
MSGRLTAEELDAAACEWAERTAREQGLPVGITDPVWLDQLATFMTSTPGTSPHPPRAETGRRPAEPPSPSGSPPPSTRPGATPAGPGRGSLPAA